MEQEVDFKWPPLESNPEVFTEYLRNVGLPEDWFISEVFGLDEDCLSFVPKPVIAVIATFENLKKDQHEKEDKPAADVAEVPYYMKQTSKLDYACGVIACIHSVLNNLDKVQVSDGSVLDRFYQVVRELSPQDSALTLENMKDFQETHKKFAAQGQSSQAQSESDVKHHFIAFVLNAKGQLVELDGMKAGPLVVKDKSEDLLADTAALLAKRVENGEYSESLAVLTLSKTPQQE